jgi:magnesium chelatase subunit D
VTYPLSAIVGQDTMRLGLLLVAVDPQIGGVLLRGEKGTAKSTAARGLASLLPGDAPFVELPLSATEDRLAGSIDVGAALGRGEVVVQTGLLAAADGGVLYVDEVNLLPDHLVDIVLDSAASGRHRIEREGVSHEHLARFSLVASMNPEEGELRPQLLDRFGLCVEVRAPDEAALRAEVVRRRLAYDQDPSGFAAAWTEEESELSRRIGAARSASSVVPREIDEAIARLCLAAGAEGMRADLTVRRAATAHARWRGALEVERDDVSAAAQLALPHRQRRRPFDPPSMPPERLEDAMEEAFGSGAPESGTDGSGSAGPEGEPPETVFDVGEPIEPINGPQVVARAPGRRGPRPDAESGRAVGSRAFDGASLAVGATLRRAAASGHGKVEDEHLRSPRRQARSARLTIFVVDASGSMAAMARMEQVKGAVLGCLADAYEARDRVAMVTFRGQGAEVIVAPTSSVEVARERLGSVPTGGLTPLAAGLEAGLELALKERSGAWAPRLVVLTDGRHTVGGDPKEVASEIAQRGIAAEVVDTEAGPVRTGLAKALADAMKAEYRALA